MELKLKTAPAKPVLTVEQVKPHLCLTTDYTEQDSVIQDYIDSAVAEIDGIAGMLNRALITQSWTAVMDDFPSSIVLPLPPGQSVTSVKYYDSDGVLQTVSASNYLVTYANHEFRKMVVHAAEAVRQQHRRRGRQTQ